MIHSAESKGAVGFRQAGLHVLKKGDCLNPIEPSQKEQHQKSPYAEYEAAERALGSTQAEGNSPTHVTCTLSHVFLVCYLKTWGGGGKGKRMGITRIG